MKILPMFLFLMAINIALLMFSAGANQNLAENTSYFGSDGAITNWDSVNPGSAGLNQYQATNNGSSTLAGYSSMDFWNAALNPSGGNNSNIILYLVAFALLIGALGFIPFINRSDLSVLSGPFIILLAVAGPTIVGLYSFINGQSSAMLCNLDKACFMSNLLGGITAGVLFIAWILAVTEWWSGRPVS